MRFCSSILSLYVYLYPYSHEGHQRITFNGEPFIAHVEGLLKQYRVEGDRRKKAAC